MNDCAVLGETNADALYLFQDMVNEMAKEHKTCSGLLVVYLSWQMARILEAVHEKKLIHGDIKPDNFMISGWLVSSFTCLLFILFCSVFYFFGRARKWFLCFLLYFFLTVFYRISALAVILSSVDHTKPELVYRKCSYSK